MIDIEDAEKAQMPSGRQNCSMINARRNAELRNGRILLPSVIEKDFQDTPGRKIVANIPKQFWSGDGRKLQMWKGCETHVRALSNLAPAPTTL